MSKNKGIAAVLLLLVILSLAACGEKEQSPLLTVETLTEPQQVNYKTVQTRQDDYVKTASGQVSAVYLLWAELSWNKSNARYQEILVKTGQQVKKGDVLAIFDIEGSKAEQEELKLKLSRAQADATTGAEERLAAIQDAQTATEGLTSHELQIAMLKLDKLQAEYEQFVYQSQRETEELKESLKALEQEHAEDTLLAPFDGVIKTVISYHPGDQVPAGQVLITMHATDQLFLEAKDTSGNLRYNMEVTIEAGSKEQRKSFSGRVVAAPNILPAELSQSLTLIELDEDISEEELRISPQYQCNTEELQDILIVDRKAVNTEDKKSYVYVLEEGMVQKRYIVPGFSNMDVVWVLDGLSAGQSLIVD